MNALRSRKYIDGSRDQRCTLRIAEVCTGGGEDTVFAHIRDRHTGRSIKASDLSGADACGPCHRKFDGQSGEPLSETDWLFYALRGLQETLENRVARGILGFPHDPPPKPKKARPRKAAPARRPIPNRGFPKVSRPIPSRGFDK